MESRILFHTSFDSWIDSVTVNKLHLRICFRYRLGLAEINKNSKVNF